MSSLVSDLLGVTAQRMLHAVAVGATDPEAIAALARRRLRATAEQLRDALGACQDLHPVYRRLVGMALADLQLLARQIDQSIRNWRISWPRIKTPCSGSPRCPASASTPPRRSSPRWEPPRRRSPRLTSHRLIGYCAESVRFFDPVDST